ncbi:TatD family deoxyribonuclease [Maribrevibacterium harenarium]|uniref:TatD family deoxyribonuclease n=1 Tax=Maribrevibacterium harenarium TaxID=2589817 RepID=A0A501X2C9_9GAMM|nr:TatD family hydrolase [Maribrevibacterium harenarium]TPE54646.1 TatD family deoxyribonuclease [Maribrevibacterium harenarium]
MQYSHWIDSHCHLDFSDFEQDLETLIDACFAEGVKGFLVPGTERRTWNKVITLSHHYDAIRYALGIHPYFLDNAKEEDLSCLSSSIDERTVAVGEIGLDAWQGMPSMERQLFYFRHQLQIAKDHGLPVILHTRKADDLVLKTLREVDFKNGGVVHAFNGSLQQAQRYLQLGFKIGIGGTITYPRAQKARTVAAALPNDSFVLETDSPDMPILGYQGQRNTPLQLLCIADVLRQLRQQEMNAIMQHSTHNLINVLPRW